ncbi:fatty acyl-CoA reductase wat-like [Aethina tumida]|uniref:fatty acyl-CoA reductase wat-like n=1 Tax=Aethina tumida TaxID=116153 RepID=UPI00096ADE7F|nr:fatty acyl-CoA reductase wat-like [Aethina tumida]
MTTIDKMDLNEHHSQTPIQSFYAKTNVFITGATGFLGKILVEKLLRSCPDINTIYVLVRNKKGKNLHTRVDELFDDVIFDRLRTECPKFRHKVVGVAGDCSLPALGLTLHDQKTLIDEVNVIFHVAATVKFDEKLKLAVAINVRGPRDMIELSKRMKQLKSFVHVSTAYSMCNHNYIEERIYTPHVDSHKLVLLAENLPDKILDSVTPALLDKYPNTYAFTKGIAEDMIKCEGRGIPIGVFRPSIVISTYREPIKAWINNLYGPTGVCAGAGTGVLRTMHCHPKVNANIVPVDMVVNAMIACGWEIAKNYEENKLKADYEIPVYNYESSNDKPINWGEYMSYSETSGVLYPSVKAIWYYFLTLQPTWIGYFITQLFLHYIPALIVDGALLCVGKSPMMLKVYRKIHKFSSVISYFCTRNWTFHSQRINRMIETMTPEDQEIFFCDLKKLNWAEYFTVYLKGIREYLIQDPMTTLNDARNKWKRLYVLHQTLKVLLGFLCLRLLWSVLQFIQSFMW